MGSGFLFILLKIGASVEGIPHFREGSPRFLGGVRFVWENGIIQVVNVFPSYRAPHKNEPRGFQSEATKAPKPRNSTSKLQLNFFAETNNFQKRNRKRYGII